MTSSRTWSLKRRIITAAIIVDVVFAVFDFLAYFSPVPMTLGMYWTLQWAFPICVLAAMTALAYWLVLAHVTSVRRRLLMCAGVVALSLVFAAGLGALFMYVQMQPIWWLNGPLWGDKPFLSMSLSATIALWVFPALAYAAACAGMMRFGNQKPARRKARA